jgi:hypothetical protein
MRAIIPELQAVNNPRGKAVAYASGPVARN